MSRPRLLTLLTLLLLGATAASAAPPMRRLLLAVGANNGGPGRAQLRYANADAARMAEVMVDLGGVAPNDAQVLVDASRDQFQKALQRLDQKVRRIRRAGGRVEIVIYYSGHSDETGLLLGARRIGYRALRHGIEAIPAQIRVAVVDSCASGALTRAKGSVRRAPFVIDTSVDVTGQAFLTSSSQDEVAQESDRVGGSFFTHYLVSGLRGAADISRDGKVTLNEAYRYAYDETLARTERTRNGPQHAAYDIQLAGTGDLVITDLRASRAKLVLAPELRGRIFVRGPRGHLIAELRKVRGRAVTLGLDAGTYSLTAMLPDGIFGARTTLQTGRRTRIRRSDFQKVALESTVARGDLPAPAPAELDTLIIIEPLLDDADPHTHVPFNLGLVPPVSMNAGREDIINNASFSLVASYGDILRGAEFTFGANIRGSSARGAQIAGGANITLGMLSGLQIAGAFNQADIASGAQITLGANLALEALRGVQISLGYNHTRGGRGGQIGAINTAWDHFRGAQIGLLNIGGDIHGVQIGLINYADNVDVPIGLLNIVRDGLHNVSVFTSDLNGLNLGLRLGGRYFYNWLTAGFQPGQDAMRWSIGLGIGGHIPLRERLFVQLDFAMHKVTAGGRFNDLHLLGRFRAGVGFKLAAHLAIIGGFSASGLASFDGRLDNLGYGAQTTLSDDGDVAVSAWPGFYVGLEL